MTHAPWRWGLALWPLLTAADPAETIRHEYLSPEVLREATAALGSASRLEGGGPGAMPDALVRDGERLPAPRDDRPDAPRVVDGAQAGVHPPGSILRPDRARPDRSTGVDANLTYHALFNPEVAPLRRNVAFNEVGPGPAYEMTVRSPAPRVVPVLGGEPGPGREAFWGDLSVDVQPGQLAPVPSVAPDMHLLALRTEPASDAVLLRDAADNYYVRANHGGSLRIVFLVDADRRYFSGPAPANVPLDALAADPDAALPDEARAAAKQVLNKIGVTPTLPFDRGLGRLVAYFRAFVAGELPDGPGDLYLDLALGGTGVCRHRAFAFLVTARAAGIPTRYVQNEAHAFVEVKVPDGSWRRVDLGGQAPNLDIKGAEGGRLHTPPPDAFPKPESYLSGYSAQLLRGQGTPKGKGGSLKPLGPGARPSPALPDPNDPNAPRSEIPIPSPGEGDAGTSLAPPRPGAVAGDPLDAGPRSFSGAPAASVPAPRPVRLTLDAGAGGEVYRGEELPFEARGALATPEGEAVAGIRVQVFLVPVDGGEPLAVGAPVRTAADGRFAARLRLPQTLPLGRYRLLAASEGGAFAPARSDTP